MGRAEPACTAPRGPGDDAKEGKPLFGPPDDGEEEEEDDEEKPSADAKRTPGQAVAADVQAVLAGNDQLRTTRLDGLDLDADDKGNIDVVVTE